MSGFGTGFFSTLARTRCPFLRPSRHVVGRRIVETVGALFIRGDAVLWDRRGGYSRAQIVGRHKSLDLMILRMPQAAGKSRFAQTVLDFDRIAQGERIMIFGHPEGLFFSLADGLVSRKDPAGSIQITAPVSPGRQWRPGLRYARQASRRHQRDGGQDAQPSFGKSQFRGARRQPAPSRRMAVGAFGKSGPGKIRRRLPLSPASPPKQLHHLRNPMPSIDVTVFDSTENKRVPVELPDDAPANKLIAVLIEKLKLPRSGLTARH